MSIRAAQEQLPNVLDRAIRIAAAERAPTALIIPADVQELPYSAPSHAFKMVPSSIGTEWPVPAPDDEAILRAAEVLNAGSKVAILAGQGARGARRELEGIAELLGAGVANALLGRDVLSDELPYVTRRTTTTPGLLRGIAQRIPAGERNAHRATLTDIDTGQIRRKLVLTA